MFVHPELPPEEIPRAAVTAKFAALLDQKALSQGEIEGLKALVARLDKQA